MLFRSEGFSRVDAPSRPGNVFSPRPTRSGQEPPKAEAQPPRKYASKGKPQAVVSEVDAASEVSSEGAKKDSVQDRRGGPSVLRKWRNHWTARGPRRLCGKLRIGSRIPRRADASDPFRWRRDCEDRL